MNQEAERNFDAADYLALVHSTRASSATMKTGKPSSSGLSGPSAATSDLNCSVNSGIHCQLRRWRDAFTDLVAVNLDRPWILVATLIDGQDRATAQCRQSAGLLRQPDQVARTAPLVVGGYRITLLVVDQHTPSAAPGGNSPQRHPRRDGCRPGNQTQSTSLILSRLPSAVATRFSV